LREQLRDFELARLESNMDAILAAADGSAEEKSATLKKIYGTDNLMINHGMEPAKLWEAAVWFRDLLSPEQRKTLLRSDHPVEAPIAKLDEGVRRKLMAAWSDASKDSHYQQADPKTGVLHDIPTPEPQVIRFTRWKYGSTSGIMPFVAELPTPMLFGGMDLEREYRAFIHELWMLPCDSAGDPALDRAMSVPRLAKESKSILDDPKNAELAGDVNLQLFRERMQRVSEWSSTPLVARLPLEDESATHRLNDVSAITLREYWKQLWRGTTMLKWHEGVQIVSTEAWPYEDLPVPLWLVRALRKHAKPGQLLPIDDLLACADLLTQKQLMRLKPEFPTMENVARAQGILALLHRFPTLGRQALSEQGIALTPDVAGALEPLLPGELWKLVADGQAKRMVVRLIENDKDPALISREVVFWLYGDNNKRLRGYGFIQRPQPNLKPPIKQQ
jgi:hypothetical protein